MAKIRLAVGLIWLVSLLGFSTPAIADPSIVKWSGVNIPTEGESGNWVLANGSDVQHLTMAIDGTLYCYANPSGTSYTLFKSTDGGSSWSYTGRVKDAIVDIAAAPDDASIVYYATMSDVYKSTDGGSSFTRVADATLPVLDDNESITCLDVGYDSNDDPYVFIGIADTDDGDFGGVYCLPEADSEAKWTDIEVGTYDVYSVACSPKFKNDSQIIAIVTDETHTYVINNYGVIGEWPNRVELLEADANSFAITAASDICFPSDFDSTYELFVGVVTHAGGDVYRVTSDSAYDLNAGADIISLDLVGEAGNIQLMAGAQDDNEVYYSTDDGDSWDTPDKTPSGDGPTYVVMADDFAESGRAYAATSGTESALSVTQDGGITWNQAGLIDTIVGSGNILDLAISPNSPEASQDNTLFMLTFDGEHSLWRSLNGGTRWERVFTSALANVESIKLVQLSPQYGNGSQVVFLAGVSNANPAIWKSTDNGQTFIRRGVTFPIDVWAVVNDNTLFIGSHDGSDGLVYRTTDSGLSYSSGAVAGSQPLKSIALSPYYEQDKTIVVGNTSGWVYWSNDDGTTLEPLGQQLPQLIAEAGALNDIIVTLDPQFSTNNTVYAASHCYKDTEHSSAIYRFIIGTSSSWESIDSNLPEGSMLSQLVVSADGTLYTTNFKADGGMERCLNPTYPLGPTFETVTRGLDDGAGLSGLWLSDNQLWSIDTKNTRLMTFTDSLTQPITLTSPCDKAPGIGTIIGSTIRNVNLDWESLSGATSYHWQLDYNADFSTVPAKFGDNTTATATSARLPSLEPATTYYWGVRVTEPLLSPWSARRSFTTSLGTTAIAPSLKSPGSGAKWVELEPVFQWSAIAGAESYELLVSTDVSLASPLIKKTGVHTLPATAWQSDTSLDYDTTYYWKVRAIGSNTRSAWSAVSAFTTKSPPSEPSPASEPLPSYSTAPNLHSPQPGARGMPLRPVFQWSAIAGADSYELLLATDASFANPVIIKIAAYALPSTAWQSDISLDYDTTYYWKVRAGSSETWSAAGAFTTESPPAEPSPPPELSPPPSAVAPLAPSPLLPAPAQPTIPDWVKYLIGGLLLTTILLLVTMLILVIGIRRF